MIKNVVGTRTYSVWTDTLKRLVPGGRTHRLSVVVGGMLQVAYEIAREKEKKNAPAKKLVLIFEQASECEDDAGLLPLIRETEKLFEDAGARFGRANRKGDAYSIAEEAVQQFLHWDEMPWE
jgi:hypothetical protein